MKYYSEHTKQFYNTAEECEKVESEILIREQQEKIAKAKLNENRTKRAKEVEEAFKQASESTNKAKVLLNSFVKDYGSFHMTLDTPQLQSNFDYLFGDFFSNFGG